MRSIIMILFLSILLLGIVAPGITHGGMEDPDSLPPKENMEKIRGKIDALRMWRLTTELDLDEGSAARLFPLLNRYDKKRAEIQRDIRLNMMALRKALREERHEELRAILQRLEDKHRELQRVEEDERQELRRILTVEQQARYLIFQHEFNREIQNIIAKAKRRHRKDIPPMEVRPR